MKTSFSKLYSSSVHVFPDKKNTERFKHSKRYFKKISADNQKSFLETDVLSQPENWKLTIYILQSYMF